MGISVIVLLHIVFYVSAYVTFYEDVPFFARPDPTESTPQVLPISSFEFETFVIAHKPTQPQTGPEFKRYSISCERKCVRVLDTVPTDSNNSVKETNTNEETAPPLSGDSDNVPILSPAVVSPSPSVDLPIALHKACHHPTMPLFLLYLLSLFLRLSRKNYPTCSNKKEELPHPGWRQATIDEITALESTGTWKLVPLPPKKSTAGCWWVFAIKVGPDGQLPRWHLFVFSCQWLL
ncbi:retrovirus-related Pol polyprotein from transposon TNT 1-94 [Trifolium medium]|uniref:Retrovirus-related Pol polyprotein from transposon TNT 1-94 n=1 Tax=Trifolium medium TaxID=97028 RepID=A0A392M669_9FABA|nr:retrovirus-related Pol polyprotein from transposon TNT 1-94 [Trifolium medium]